MNSKRELDPYDEFRGTNPGKSEELVINGTDGLLNGLLERPPDTHDFTNTLHAAAQKRADAVELLEVPARDLDDNIVQAGLEARRGHLRHRVLDLVQRDAETELRGDEREGVSSRLRRERRGARETCIDLVQIKYPAS